MTIVRGDVVAWLEMQREDVSGTTYDEHGQNDGTINGATLSNDTPLSKGIGSFSFSGTSSYITIPNSAELNSFWAGGGTISLWVKPNSADDFDRILSKLSPTNGWLLDVRALSGGNYEIGFVQRFSTQRGVWSTSASLANNSWNCIQIVYDSDSTANDPTIYVNGTSLTVDEDLSPSGSASYDGAIDIEVGRDNDGSNEFVGNITGLKFFNRTITSTEASNLYNSGDGVTYRSFFNLEESLEGWWKLDGDALDATANNNDGTVNGATSGSQGVIGTAYDFDGSNDTIDIPDDPSLDAGTGDFSVGFWFKLDTLSSTTSPLSKRSTGSTGWTFQFYTASGRLAFICSDGTDTAVTPNSNMDDLNDGAWHFAVATRDSSNIRIYVDGDLKNTTSASSVGDVSNATDFVFGNQSGGSQYMDGLMDEGFFYSRKLFDGEVRRLYSHGVGLRYEDLDNESFLIDGTGGAWEYTDGSGSTVSDAKNNTYDMTLVNSPTWGTGGPTDTPDYVSFDGVDQRGEVGSSYVWDMDNGEKTLATWFNTDDHTARQGLIARNTAASNQWFHLALEGTGFSEDLGLFLDDGSTSIARGGGTSLADNTWFHTVGTVDTDGTNRVYLDNTEVATAAGSNVTPASTADLWIGFTTANSSYMDGEIAQTVVWNRTLSTTEINALYNGGSGNAFPFSLGQSFTQELTETLSLAQDLDQTDYYIAGTVTLSGSAQSGAVVILYDDTDSVAVGEDTTDANGEYEFDLLDNQHVYHAAVQYDDGGGNQYNDESKPYLSPASRTTDLDGA